MNRLRPGSLTFLAVANFAGAGLLLLGSIGALTHVLIASGLDLGAPREALKVIRDLPLAYHVGNLTRMLLCGLLLILSGIGYLRLSPLLGRWGGTAYALCSLGWLAVESIVFARLSEGGEAPGVGTVAWAVYPLLTLVWLHGVVRDVWSPQRRLLGDTTATAPAAAQPWSFRRHLLLNARQSLRQTLRGASGLALVFMLLFGCLGGIALLNLTWTNAQRLASDHGMPAEQSRVLAQTTAPLLMRAYYGEPVVAVGAAAQGGLGYDRWGEFLGTDHPLLLSWGWLLLTVLLPMIAPLGSYALIATDAQHRGFRFLLLRTDRRSVYLGRFLGAAVLVCATVAVTAVAAGLLTGSDLRHQGAVVDWPVIVAWTVRAALALALVALPWLALGQWISAAIPSPIGGLALTQALVIALPGIAYAAGAAWAPGWWLMAASPFALHPLLFHHQPLVAVAAALGLLAWTALFLHLGLRRFQTRDL